MFKEIKHNKTKYDKQFIQEINEYDLWIANYVEYLV